MKNTLVGISLLIFLTPSFNSCGGAAAKLGGKALQKIVKNFAKSSTKNSSRLIRGIRKAPKTKIIKGRLVPVDDIAKYSKVKIPSPKNIRVISNGALDEGSAIATKGVTSTDIDLVLYDAIGNPIVYSNKLNNKLIYNSAQRAYQRKAIKLVDDIFDSVKKTKISSDAELKNLVNEAVKKRLGTSTSENPVIMNVATGDLTFNVEFFNGSQVVGKINIYDAVKKGVVVGATGYYVSKNI